MEAGDWVLADVQAVVAQALESDGHVLSAGEHLLARRLLGLGGAPGRLWARLTGRKGSVFRIERLAYGDVPDVPAALQTLRSLDLVHGSVPESQRLDCYTVPELKAVCRRAGLPTGGRRAQVTARLTEVRGWALDPVVRVSGGALLRRLEALCFQDRWQDRSVWLLERLGVTRWPVYDPTPRAPGFRTRAAFAAWAAPIPEDAPPEDVLARLQATPRRPRWQRRLCLRRRLERHLVSACRALERAGEPARAAALYQALLAAGATHPGEVAARLALATEASEGPGPALAAAVAWRSQAAPVARVALDRIGRRLARRGGGGWPPEAPLRTPPERRLGLVRAAEPGPRPLWGEPPIPVEAAVSRAVPRRVIAAENALWTTLRGLLLLDLFWLPVPGMLPRPHLAGPLDLGTPDFAHHRRDALEARLEALEAGAGPALLRTAWAHHGVRIRGIAWELASLGALEACVAGVGGRALSLILRRLAEEGWAAAVGLPDLAVLPGPHCRLADAFPSRLGDGLLLVEVKGPGDTVRDAQAVWFDRLLAAGAPVEIWRVEHRPGR